MFTCYTFRGGAHDDLAECVAEVIDPGRAEFLFSLARSTAGFGSSETIDDMEHQPIARAASIAFASVLSAYTWVTSARLCPSNT